MSSESSAQLEPWTRSNRTRPDRISFLDLPRELRDAVYQYAFQVPGAIFLYTRPNQVFRAVGALVVRYQDEGPLEPAPLGSAIPMALLRTCRQMHVEGSGVLYGDNIFRLYSADGLGVAPLYKPLVRSVVFEAEVERLHSNGLEVITYWWRTRFWPGIVAKSERLFARFPGLESLTFPIKSNRHGETWRPAFCAYRGMSRERRVAIAADVLKRWCPMPSEHFRERLHLEIAVGQSSRLQHEASRFTPDAEDDWDPSEFADAFERSKSL